MTATRSHLALWRAAAVLFSLSAAPVLGACSRGESPRATGATPSATASAKASASASATPGTSAAPSGSAAPAVAGRAAFAGTYEATAGSLHVPEGKEYEGVKFRGAASEAGLGKGTLSLELTGSLVRGTSDGPLGSLVVEGTVEPSGSVVATLRPAAPTAAPAGFYGTLTAAPAGTGVEGTMSLSSGDGSVLRTAKVQLTRK